MFTCPRDLRTRMKWGLRTLGSGWRGLAWRTQMIFKPFMLPLGLNLISLRALGPEAIEDAVLALGKKQAYDWFVRGDLHVGNCLGMKTYLCWVAGGWPPPTWGSTEGYKTDEATREYPGGVGMGLSPEGFRKGRKEKRLYRVGKGMNMGMNTVGGGDHNLAEAQGWRLHWALLQATEKVPHEKCFVARTFQSPSPWVWPSCAISLTSSPIQALLLFFLDSSHPLCWSSRLCLLKLLPKTHINFFFKPWGGARYKEVHEYGPNFKYSALLSDNRAGFFFFDPSLTAFASQLFPWNM